MRLKRSACLERRTPVPSTPARPSGFANTSRTADAAAVRRSLQHQRSRSSIWLASRSPVTRSRQSLNAATPRPLPRPLLQRVAPSSWPGLPQAPRRRSLRLFAPPSWYSLPRPSLRVLPQWRPKRLLRAASFPCPTRERGSSRRHRRPQQLPAVLPLEPSSLPGLRSRRPRRRRQHRFARSSSLRRLSHRHPLRPWLHLSPRLP